MTTPMQETYCKIDEVGDSLLVRALFFPKSVIEHVEAVFDPSAVRIAAGEITLHAPGKASALTFQGLCSLSQNKPGDIILWNAMSADHRAKYCTVAEDVPVEEDTTSRGNETAALQKMGVILLVYALHGSLSQLALTPPQVPKFALAATNLKAEEFSPDRVASTVGFLRAKFPGFATNFHTLALKFPQTLKSRIKLGIAGNRIFSIIKKIRTPAIAEALRTTVIGGFFVQEIVAGAPYFSLHPDHEMNPMKDHAKRLYAEIGEVMRNNGIDIDTIARRSPSLFIGPVVASLKMLPADVDEELPDRAKVVAAFTDDYSIRGMLE